jgi:predicted transcriptional regulator
MAKPIHVNLTRRERQIIDILYRRGRASAGEVMNDLPDKPSYSTVRTQLRVLEQKGYVQHGEENLRYVYEPIAPRDAVRVSALTHVMDTFFEGSVQKVVAALLGRERSKITTEDLDKIADLVEKARKGGRR